MSKADLQKKLATLQAIPFDRLQKPKNMPVAIYLREAEEMLAAGRNDLAQLQKIGFQAEWLADLALRIGALRRAESVMLAELYSRGEAAKRWDAAAPRGFALLKELRETFLFAYRQEPVMLALVREAVQGRSAQAMVQGLSNLAVLGRDNSAPLEAINFEPNLLDEAAALADRLGDLLGAYDAEREGQYDCTLLRDAAFTHLKEGLKRLREYGLYVFRSNVNKKLHYTSDYLRKMRLARKKRSLSQPAELESAGEKALINAHQREVDPAKAFSQEESGRKNAAEVVEHCMQGPEERGEAVELWLDPAELRRRPSRGWYEGAERVYGPVYRLI